MCEAHHRLAVSRANKFGVSFIDLRERVVHGLTGVR